MLSVLLLAAGLQAAPAPRPAPEPTGFNLSIRSPLCEDLLTRTTEPVTPGRGLAWRQGDPPVRMYLLFDRRVDGCPAPIVVMERAPGSNAIRREMSRPSTLETRPRP